MKHNLLSIAVCIFLFLSSATFFCISKNPTEKDVFYSFKLVELVGLFLSFCTIFIGAYLTFSVSQILSKKQHLIKTKKDLIDNLLTCLKNIETELVDYSNDLKNNTIRSSLLLKFIIFSNALELVYLLKKPTNISPSQLYAIKLSYFDLKDKATVNMGTKGNSGPDLSECTKIIIKLRKHLYLTLLNVTD